MAFTDAFPFTASAVEEAQLATYYLRRGDLRDLFTDETNQLDTLTKAIRIKGYTEEEK